MRLIPIAAALLLSFLAPAFAADKPTRFWNLTSATVSDLRLAPAGTQNFGENLCRQDKDSEVEHDERLNIAGLVAGTYDARIGFPDGTICTVKNLSIAAGDIFSIEDKDLAGCAK
jgi:hypothetical protein